MFSELSDYAERLERVNALIPSEVTDKLFEHVQEFSDSSDDGDDLSEDHNEDCEDSDDVAEKDEDIRCDWKWNEPDKRSHDELYLDKVYNIYTLLNPNLKSKVLFVSAS